MLNPHLIRLADRVTGQPLRQRPVRPPPSSDPQTLAVAVGYVIFRVRWRAGLSQREFASRLGINRSAVSRWESGQRFPTLSHLTLVGELVGRRASAMLTEAEDMVLAAGADRLDRGCGRDGSHSEDDHAADD